MARYFPIAQLAYRVAFPCQRTTECDFKVGTMSKRRGVRLQTCQQIAECDLFSPEGHEKEKKRLLGGVRLLELVPAPGRTPRRFDIEHAPQVA